MDKRNYTKNIDVLYPLRVTQFIIYPIVDGQSRHHSKCITRTDHKLTRNLNHVKLVSDRNKALSLATHMSYYNLTKKELYDQIQDRNIIEKYVH